MCGIFGVHARASLDLSAAIDRSTDLMTHRGPDGRGVHRARSADGEWQVGLGHRRLSIVDIAGSPQPMTSHDGRYTLVFNGEIYNYVELRAELVARGHVFRTNGDTETILEAYRAWGTDCVRHLRGMFAFLLWDTAADRLFAARDHYGEKPLFVVEGQGFTAFASEIEPLVRFPGVDDALDWDSVREYLGFRYVPGPATFFRSVKKLKPGTLMVIEGGNRRTERFFTTPFSTATPDMESFETALDAFEAELDRSVEIRLRSEAPFGAFLSGGLDSSVVVALMSRHMAAPVRTFSVGFDVPGSSELPYAAQVAEAYRTEHSELVVGERDFAGVWEEAVLRRGAPVSEPSDLPILLLAKHASRTVKMVLTGEGSDELLGGYPKHRAEPWVTLYQSLVPALLHDRLVDPAVRALPYAFRRLKIVASAAGVRAHAARMPAWFGGADDDLSAALYAGPEATRELDPTPFATGEVSALKKMLHYDQTSWLPDNLLERGDRMTMAGSIEARLPFMDVRLAELVARFPDAFLTGAPKGKRILRALAAKLIPREIIERKKVGFRVPVETWFRSGLKDTMGDLLLSSSSEVRRLCTASEIDRLVGEHMEARQNHEKVLWSLANLERFLRLYRPALDAPMAASRAA